MHSVEIDYIHADVHDAHDAPASPKHPMGDQCSALDALDSSHDDGCAQHGEGEFSVPAEENPNTFVGRVGVAEMPEPVINVQQSSQLDEMALFNLLRQAQDLLPERPIPSERRADMHAMISRLPRLTSTTDEPHHLQQNYARARPKTLDEFLMGARLRQPARREGLLKPQSEY